MPQYVCVVSEQRTYQALYVVKADTLSEAKCLAEIGETIGPNYTFLESIDSRETLSATERSPTCPNLNEKNT